MMQITVQNPMIAELAQWLDTLPADKAKLVCEAVKSLVAEEEQDSFSKTVSQLNATSKSFAFLNDEPDDLYSTADLIQVYRKPNS